MKKLIFALCMVLTSLLMVSCESVYAVTTIPETNQEVMYEYAYDTTTDVSVIVSVGTPYYYNGSLMYYYYRGWYYYPYYYGGYWYFRPYSRPYRYGYIPRFDRPRHYDRRFESGRHGFSKPSIHNNGLPRSRDNHVETFHYGNKPTYNRNSSTRFSGGLNTQRPNVTQHGVNRGGFNGNVSRGGVNRGSGVTRGGGRR